MTLPEQDNELRAEVKQMLKDVRKLIEDQHRQIIQLVLK